MSSRKAERIKQHSPLIVVSFFILISIFFTSWALFTRADQEMRSDLHLQSRIAANVVNIPAFEKLTGTEADLKSDYYKLLKQQLASVRSTTEDYRFIYLMGKNSAGKIFFFVDSEEETSKDYSPPGQIYEEADANLVDLFATKVGYVEGPFQDAWGTWVTALTPLTNPNTGGAVAVLGIDVNADLWKFKVFSKIMPSIALMLVMMLVIVVYLYKAVRAFSES